MSGVLEGVDRRTKMVGQNRLELLLFHLGDKQLFAINVFKVQEVIPCPPLKRLPNAHPIVRGISHIRGHTVSVIDLARSMGRRGPESTTRAFVIVTAFNRSVQGFLVSSVDRIVNLNWDSIRPPPKGADTESYLTAVTNVDNVLVEIIDVEKILEMVTGPAAPVTPELFRPVEGGAEPPPAKRIRRVLVADDSSVARKQMVRALAQIDIDCIVTRDGREALNKLIEMAEAGDLHEQISMVISDIEMPDMDGYTLVSEIRKNPALADMYVLLHSSLSGEFNDAMVKRAGANKFIPKFDPNDLAGAVMMRIRGEV